MGTSVAVCLRLSGLDEASQRYTSTSALINRARTWPPAIILFPVRPLRLCPAHTPPPLVGQGLEGGGRQHVVSELSVGFGLQLILQQQHQKHRVRKAMQGHTTRKGRAYWSVWLAWGLLKRGVVATSVLEGLSWGCG